MQCLVPVAGKRQTGESDRAVLAFNDYARMGPGRSLEKQAGLYRSYTEDVPEKPPTRHITTLKQWSRRYHWVERARAYDAETERLKNERAHRTMRSGLALPHNRVRRLKRLYRRLEAEIEKGRHWLKDVKQVGAGDNARIVELERFNHALVSEMRGLLDDLAKETGGRKQKSEVEITGLADFLAQVHQNGYVPPPKPVFDYEEARFLDEADEDPEDA